MQHLSIGNFFNEHISFFNSIITIAQLVKLQAERALQRKEEEKKKAKEEEERKKKQEEEEEKINKEDGLTDTGYSSKDEKASKETTAEIYGFICENLLLV